MYQDFCNVFSEVYEKDTWGNGSGTGSDLKYNKNYISELEKFLKKHEIKSIVDFGCGDWQFSKKIKFGNIKYIGYDVVENLIKTNTKKYANENIKFLLTPENTDEIPNADLLLCKDVLQHFEEKYILHFIQNILPKFKYAIITNCFTPIERQNIPIITGDAMRPLNLMLPPYNLNLKLFYIYPLAYNATKISFIYSSDCIIENNKKYNDMFLLKNKLMHKLTIFNREKRRERKKQYNDLVKIFKIFKELNIER